MYTIILNTNINDHRYKSLIYLSISQCQPAWKKWNREKWIDCIYRISGGDQDTGYVWYTEHYYPLFYIDFSIYSILMILLLIGVFKRDKLYVFLEAWSHYQQWFIILWFIIWSSNSSNVMKTLFFTLTPYLTPFAILRLFNMEYILLAVRIENAIV